MIKTEAQATNPIQQENAKPGTPGWQLTKGAANGEIQAYTGEDSINPGQDVHLYVSTTASRYLIQVYRLGYYQGVGARLVWSDGGVPGISQGYYHDGDSNPTNCSSCMIGMLDSKGQQTNVTDANWKLSYTIPFSSSWVSGVYFIKLTDINGYQWSVPVILRNDAQKADLIYDYPVNTEQAYNDWGGTSFYRDFRDYPGSGTDTKGYPFWAFYLSFNRPYIDGFGSEHLFSWLYQMIYFMESQGYDMTYTTSTALSSGATNLLNYKGFVSAGHDEYWSYNARHNLEQAIASNVNVAFFGANDMYWQVRYAADAHNIPYRYVVCYKDYSNYKYPDPYDTNGNPYRYLTTTLWRASPLNDPEDRVLKEMYPDGAGGNPQNFIVANTSNWIFNGTGMHDGDVVKGILGIEVGSIFNDGSITSQDHVTIVGQSPFVSYYSGNFTADAMIDERGSGNIIFNAGTIDWPVGLYGSSITPKDNRLIQITNNILYRMVTGKIPPTATPSPTATPTDTPSITQPTQTPEDSGTPTPTQAYTTTPTPAPGQVHVVDNNGNPVSGATVSFCNNQTQTTNNQGNVSLPPCGTIQSIATNGKNIQVNLNANGSSGYTIAINPFTGKLLKVLAYATFNTSFWIIIILTAILLLATTIIVFVGLHFTKKASYRTIYDV